MQKNSHVETDSIVSAASIDKTINTTSIQRDYANTEHSSTKFTPEIDLEVACTAQVENWPELSCLLRSYVRHLFAHGKHHISPGALLDMSNASPILNSCIYSVRVCDLTSSHTLSLLTETSENIVSNVKQININLIFYRLFGLHRTNNNNTNNNMYMPPIQYQNNSKDVYCSTVNGVNESTIQNNRSDNVNKHKDDHGTHFSSCEHQLLENYDEEDDNETTVEEFGLYSNTNDTDKDESCAFCTLQLPHASLDGLWESLSYGESLLCSQQLKSQLLNYVRTTLHFIAANVDPNHIAWNRMILFYGPPGTGKTSLSKALAHKIAIRCRSNFTKFKLIEINVHSVFSRWFSESGKQVVNLFTRIKQLATSSFSSSSSSMSLLLFVVIDEVESLAATREAAMKGNEPSDAIRVVNALLTQIDQLQRIRNVFVITTSNLTSAIDSAFLDRADLQLYIGPPGLEARKIMLMASVQELVSRQLLQFDFMESKANASRQTSTTTTTVNKRKWEMEETLSQHHEEQEEQEMQSEEMSEVDAATTNMSSYEYEEEEYHLEQKEACCEENVTKENGQSAQRRLMKNNVSEQHNSIPNYVIKEINHIAALCAGYNGRRMKRLPFLAFSACLSNNVINKNNLSAHVMQSRQEPEKYKCRTSCSHDELDEKSSHAIPMSAFLHELKQIVINGKSELQN